MGVVRVNTSKDSGRNVLSTCLHCNFPFEMKLKNGVPADPIGPYCYREACRAEYNEQCVALYGIELSYAALFVESKGIIDILSEDPKKAKEIIGLIKETAPWRSSGLSKEAAQNWELLNDIFRVFERPARFPRPLQKESV